MNGLYELEAHRLSSLQIFVKVTRTENDTALTNLSWVSVLSERVGDCDYDHTK